MELQRKSRALLIIRQVSSKSGRRRRRRSRGEIYKTVFKKSSYVALVTGLKKIEDLEGGGEMLEGEVKKIIKCHVIKISQAEQFVQTFCIIYKENAITALRSLFLPFFLSSFLFTSLIFSAETGKGFCPICLTTLHNIPRVQHLNPSHSPKSWKDMWIFAFISRISPSYLLQQYYHHSGTSRCQYSSVWNEGYCSHRGYLVGKDEQQPMRCNRDSGIWIARYWYSTAVCAARQEFVCSFIHSVWCQYFLLCRAGVDLFSPSEEKNASTFTPAVWLITGFLSRRKGWEASSVWSE